MNTKMYVLTEVSEFMMSYVFITKEGNAIIVDGGRPEDDIELRKLVKGRKIKAWFITHPHIDHITLFNKVMLEKDPDFEVEKVFAVMPTREYGLKCNDFEEDNFNNFLAVKDMLGDKVIRPKLHDKIIIDELEIDICFVFDETKYKLVYPTINDTSLAFRIKTPNSSVMFLGDLGPETGEILVEESADLIQADYCQMAHHGHGCVGPDCYMHISPKYCIYNAREWLYNEPGDLQDYRRWGTMRTRYWMDKIGHVKDYVTGFGTIEIDL